MAERGTKPARRAAAERDLRFYPATRARWKDVEALFGERGACGGCWCMAWRLGGALFRAGKGAGNRQRLRALVEGGSAPGLLAYDGRTPVGWCAVAPRTEYASLARSRVLAPVDQEPVWSVSCLFVLKPWRRRGISVALLREAVRLAGRKGARWVEGYPVIPHSDTAPDVFLWTGILSSFEKAGFTIVARRSEARPILRCPTDPTATRRGKSSGSVRRSITRGDDG